ncbi:radical SAM family heme chaperone HemW [uncultured Cocleimonas sp.]|uniref:radical SAM family heme chaperone HemW n=1 Tax=uncultured Cocleimonas sp. TaxID=1051587 RepID=UPI00262EB837|nr:radical SAM family heme chaperone HemW [uncultured Cocleimonas sp.]
MIPIPLSLYIHIPWCVKKCPYCDFNSHQAKGEIPEEQYTQSLISDLEAELPEIWGRSIESIFIGGGTPSLYSANAMDRLLSSMRERLTIRPNTEITMEANPGTFEQERFSAYRETGINRLSIGIQSFNDKHLKALGRIHGADEAQKSTKIAKQAGFDNFNLDIMYGLPEQTIDQAIADLKQAIDANPTHISWYQLTIEENTLFHHSPPVTPNDEILWEMQQQGQKLLADAGYYQYEVSAYAKEGKQCRHNLNYWQFGDYLGIGAGAHGKISMPDGEIKRHTKYRHPEKYMDEGINGKARSSEKKLATEDLDFEFMLNAARLKEGFTKELFEARTLLSFSNVEEKLNTLIEKELIEYDNEKYKPTDKGWHFVNDIVNSFI